MSVDQAFLDDIIEHPDDDTPRLIFADWLDDQGDPASAARAELIRVQCRLAANPGMTGARGLFQRQQAILAEYEEQWVRDIGVPLAEWTFERGFVARVRMDASILLEDAGFFCRRVPVQHLKLFWTETQPNKIPEDLQRLRTFPARRNLISLEMPHQLLPSAAVEALASWDELTRLQVLDLSRNLIGDAGIRALVYSSLFTQLVILNLSHNEITARSVRQLINCVETLEAAGITPRLRTLILSSQPLSRSACRSIWDHPYLSRVVRLV